MKTWSSCRPNCRWPLRSHPDAATRKILESIDRSAAPSRVIYDFIDQSTEKYPLTLRARSEQPEETVFAAIRKSKIQPERGSFIRVTLPEEPIPALHLILIKWKPWWHNLLENAIGIRQRVLPLKSELIPCQIDVINPIEGLAVILVELTGS